MSQVILLKTPPWWSGVWDVFSWTLWCLHDDVVIQFQFGLMMFWLRDISTLTTRWLKLWQPGDCFNCRLWRHLRAHLSRQTCGRLSLLLLTITYYYLLTLTNSTFFTSFSILIITFNQHWSLSRCMSDNIAFHINQCNELNCISNIAMSAPLKAAHCYVALL